MKEKTVLQKLIDKVDMWQEIINDGIEKRQPDPDGIMRALKTLPIVIKADIESLLPAEKQQMENSYVAGYEAHKDKEGAYFNKYFTQTYSDEK